MRKSSPLSDPLLLRNAVQNSSSIKEALESLNLRAAGGNYKQLKYYCNLFEIEIPKSSGENHTKKARLANTIPLKEILVENSTYTNRFRIKDRCYKEKLLQEKCYSCGLGPIWNEKPITLQLDHINGIYNDHRIENLQILCPNCHSQTNTYAGRKS